MNLAIMFKFQVYILKIEVFRISKRKVKIENSLGFVHPWILEEWDYENNSKTPYEYTKCSGQKANFMCKNGHRYSCLISNKVRRKQGCPECSKEFGTSFVEQSIFYYLKNHFNASNRKNIDGHEIDIYLKDFNVGIEYDGWHYHNLQPDKEREQRKDEFFKSKGTRLLRIKEVRERTCPYSVDDIFYYNYGLNYIQDIIDWILLKLNSDIKIITNIYDDKQQIYSQYVGGEKENSIYNIYPDFAKLWHPTLNGNITPKMVSYGSNKRFWFKCDVCGFDWEMKASTCGGVNKGSCPNCHKEKIRKKCVSINLDNYEVKYYNSIAETSCNFDSQTVSKCCNNQLNTHRNHIFMFIEEYERLKNNYSNKEIVEYKKNNIEKYIPKNRTEIVSINIYTKEVFVYPYIASVTEHGLNRTIINKRIWNKVKTKSKIPYKDCVFYYKKEYDELISIGLTLDEIIFKKLK